MKESTVRERAFKIKVREVDKGFSEALGKINSLEKIFRSNGDLEKAIVYIAGDVSWLEDVRDALSNAYEALEEANYGVLGHIEENRVKELKTLTRESSDAKERLKASKYWFNWWTEKFNDNPSVHNSDDLRLAMLRYQKDFAEVERLNREIHELMSESFHPAEIQSVMDNLL